MGVSVPPVGVGEAVGKVPVMVGVAVTVPACPDGGVAEVGDGVNVILRGGGAVAVMGDGVNGVAEGTKVGAGVLGIVTTAVSTSSGSCSLATVGATVGTLAMTVGSGRTTDSDTTRTLRANGFGSMIRFVDKYQTSCTGAALPQPTGPV